jgi:trigger factor
MHITRKDISDTKVLLTIEAAEAVLAPYKEHILEKLAPEVKVPGFRDGKTPLNLVEKNVDPQRLQAEFVEDVINHLYSEAVQEQKLRPIDNPKITLKKFVPYTTLEFEAEVAILGKVTVADYKKVKKVLPKVAVTAKDVDVVVKSLQERMAETKDVERAAKSQDKVIIDFKGTDSKGKAINGADGKDYPLLLGSDTFIPGFEKNVLGMKPGDEKTFDLTFPKDYGVKALAGSKVTFAVTVKKVQEQTLPTVDDAFAATAGPFQSVKDLKDNIKDELTRERETQAMQDLEGEIVKEIAAKSTLTVPEVLINDQIERLLAELRQNLTYRGLTYQEFMEREGKTEESYRKDVLVPEAEQRVRAGLVLAEISELEGLEVTPEELDMRMQLLKGQYQDAAMQAELEKPESRQNIASRMLTEKTIQKLVEYATK